MPRSVMVIIRFCAILLLMFPLAHAFSQKFDSLEAALLKETNRNERISLLKEIAEVINLQRRSDSTALEYLQQLIQVARKNSDSLLVAETWYRMGVVRFYRDELSQSNQAYYNGLSSIYEMPELDLLKGKLYNGLGWNQQLVGRNSTALANLKIALRHAEKANELRLKASVLNNMGVIYKRVLEFDSALYSYQHSLEIARNMKDNRLTRFSINNIGAVMLSLSRPSEAINYIQEGLELNTAAQDTLELINSYTNLGVAYMDLNNPAQAQPNLVKAIALSDSLQNASRKTPALYALARLHAKEKDFKNAFLYLFEYDSLYEKIFGIKTREQSYQLEEKYLSIEEERNLLRAQNNVLVSNHRNNILIALLICASGTIAFLIIIFIQKRRNEKKLQQLNAEIVRQASNLRKVNEEMNYLNENLDRLVKERTATIVKQKERIAHFAFVNAHEIRGPLASLLGLINLAKSDGFSDQIKNALEETAHKMDDIVRKTQQNLANEDGVNPSD